MTNKNNILRLICTGREVSRIALSKATGLSKMAVTNIVNDLIVDGYVVEADNIVSDAVGPKPKALTVSPASKKAIGLSINRSQISVAVSTLDLKILFSKSKSFDPSINASMAIEICAALLSLAIDFCSDIIGIGIIAPGPIDKENGVILNPPALQALENLEIASRLQSKLNLTCPIYVEKDTFAVAMAEKLFGAGKDFSDFIYINMLHGIGGCIFTDNKILQSSNSFSGEIGHVTIDYKGQKCNCGNYGCLETFCSDRVITKKVNQTLNSNYSFSEVLKNYHVPEIDKIFLEAIDALAAGIATAVNICNPDLIILGDYLADFPDAYIKRLSEKINDMTLHKKHKINIVKSQLPNSGLIGSCSFAVSSFLND